MATRKPQQMLLSMGSIIFSIVLREIQHLDTFGQLIEMIEGDIH